MTMGHVIGEPGLGMMEEGGVECPKAILIVGAFQGLCVCVFSNPYDPSLRSWSALCLSVYGVCPIVVCKRLHGELMVEARLELGTSVTPSIATVPHHPLTVFPQKVGGWGRKGRQEATLTKEIQKKACQGSRPLYAL